ncbi:ATPase family AAA domain-containing protein 5b [Electrophorus electricus]|uniref:ATPase family AAA domain-containing protein 5b n=1 Tax=Electrophorus electricus TaxID=8005 RepID=UPI0015D07A9C|nr:ATPase family AAA domain-containing protein 5b [Electrophorus electricus]
MALYKAKLLPPEPAHITQCFTGADSRMTGEKVPENGTVCPKINRLKRPKGSAPPSGSFRNEIPSAVPKKTESSGSSDSLGCEEAGSEFVADDRKCSSTRTNKSSMSILHKSSSSNRSPKLDVLLLRKPLKQSKLEMSAVKVHCPRLQLSVLKSTNGAQCLHISDSAPDIIDLCGDEGSCEHGSEQVTMVTSVNGQGRYGRCDPPKATMKDVTRTISPCASENHMERSGRRAEFSKQIREDLLVQIQAQNRHFPARTTENTDGPSTPGCPVPGKRKQEVEGHSEGGLPKRRHLQRDFSSDALSTDASVNSDSPSRSRLSVSRRKKQARAAFDACEPPPPISKRWDDEVLWTEKYQPLRSREVMGNTASVRKLHGWLKEWKIRADVEGRKKTQEDRRMKAESSGLWDCGDFEGEQGSVEKSQELCSTTLIQGPTGVGKTAAVYACARELGFQVFEVNSSSLRSGQIILSQLTEATQSHQVGEPRCPTLPPPFCDGHKAITVRLPATARQDTSRKMMAFSAKPCGSSRMVSRARHVISPRVTLARSFKQSTEHPQNAQGPGALTLSTAESSDATELGLLSEDPVWNREKTRPPLSLILFEEVDLIFDTDVGFLTAIKTLMLTTKRPVILTTSDPLFSQTFNGRFVELSFKSPPIESIGSYLQCLCVVENVQPDPEYISFLLAENKGDIRRSILALELWARSGGGSTTPQLYKRVLSCSSWLELESGGCVDVLVDRWRTGRSLFSSNLPVLFAPPSRASPYADQSTAETGGPTFLKMLGRSPTLPNLENNEQRPRKLSRLKRKKHQSTGDVHKFTHNQCSKHAALSRDRFDQFPSPKRHTCPSAGETGELIFEESLSKLVSCHLDSLARFFETMSFLDSCLCGPPSHAAGLGGPASLGYAGADVADSSLDEPREEGVSPLNLVRLYDLLAVVEGLGFFQCRAEVSEMRRRALKLKKGRGGETWGTRPMAALTTLGSPCESDDRFWQNEPCEPSVIQKSKEVLSKVLSSRAFCCHGNKKAVAMDYLPALHSICRLERVKQQNEPRLSHYFRDIRLPLSKRTVHLLASDVYLQP